MLLFPVLAVDGPTERYVYQDVAGFAQRYQIVQAVSATSTERYDVMPMRCWFKTQVAFLFGKRHDPYFNGIELSAKSRYYSLIVNKLTRTHCFSQHR